MLASSLRVFLHQALVFSPNGSTFLKYFLQCPPDLPLDTATQIEYLSKGMKPERLTMNCSGKHAGMLTACVENNWPIENYLNPEHNLQKLINETIEDLSGEKIYKSTFDGCGAPLHAVSLIALAKIAQHLFYFPNYKLGIFLLHLPLFFVLYLFWFCN